MSEPYAAAGAAARAEASASVNASAEAAAGTASVNAQSVRSVARRGGTIIPQLKSDWRSYLPGLVFGILSALFSVALMAASAYLITRSSEQPPILYLMPVIVGVRAFALGAAFFRYLDKLSSHSAALRTMTSVRVGVFDRLVSAEGARGTAGIGNSVRGHGDSLARFVDDVNELQFLPLRVIQPLITGVFVSVASVVVVTVIYPAAGAILAAGLAVAFVLGTVVNVRLSTKADRDLAPLRGQLNEKVVSYLSGLDVLKAYGVAGDRLADIEKLDASIRRLAVRRTAAAGLTAGVVALCSGLVAVCVLWASSAGYAVSEIVETGAVGPGLTGPQLALLVLMPLSLFEVVGMVPLALSAWRKVRASLDRVEAAVPEVAVVETAVPDAAVPEAVVTDAAVPGAAGSETAATEAVPGAEVAEVAAQRAQVPSPTVSTAASETVAEASDSPGHASVQLESFSASWGAGPAIVSDVSLSLEPGDRLLVYGESGVGKSTLAAAMVGLAAHGGRYFVNGVDASALSGDALRQVVGLCEQTPHIFDASIRQNLALAKEGATDDELIEVVRRVGLGDWLERRGGLDAETGERGQLMSGGQAQRLALARCLLADFPVLILDEPTANVQPELADALMRELLVAAGSESRAILVISHTTIDPALITGSLRLV